MKFLIIAFTIIFFYSCNCQKKQNTIKMSTSNWSFTEGTVGRIGKHDVSFSNIMLQDYTLANGTATEGLAARLSIPGMPKETVGVGHVFTLEGVQYEVMEIENGTPFGRVSVKVYVQTWSFTEGTVGRIGKHDVSFSNIMLQDYTLANGTATEGLAARLFIPGMPKQTVGVGHVFTVEDVQYEVTSIENGSPSGQVLVVIHNK